MNCKAFCFFDGVRGTLDYNLPCHCGRPSRRRISGKAPDDSLFLQVQCVTAACDYSEPELDQSGGKMIVPRADIPDWIKLGKL